MKVTKGIPAVKGCTSYSRCWCVGIGGKNYLSPWTMTRQRKALTLKQWLLSGQVDFYEKLVRSDCWHWPGSIPEWSATWFVFEKWQLRVCGLACRNSYIARNRTWTSADSNVEMEEWSTPPNPRYVVVESSKRCCGKDAGFLNPSISMEPTARESQRTKWRTNCQLTLPVINSNSKATTEGSDSGLRWDSNKVNTRSNIDAIPYTSEHAIETWNVWHRHARINAHITH